MELYRPEYWSGQPSPSTVDLPHPGIELDPPANAGDIRDVGWEDPL